MSGKTIGVSERATEIIRRLKDFLAINDLDCTISYLKYEDMTEDGDFSPMLLGGEIDLLLGNLSESLWELL